MKNIEIAFLLIDSTCTWRFLWYLHIIDFCFYCKSNSVKHNYYNKQNIYIQFNSLNKYTMIQDNLFEWHFTIRGPADTEFDGGLYHGRIILPPEYPMKPPSIIVLTVCSYTFLDWQSNLFLYDGQLRLYKNWLPAWLCCISLCMLHCICPFETNNWGLVVLHT